MRFFFYGTLMDPDVRRLVLGRHAPRRVEPATLHGWRRIPVPGKTYPMVVTAAGAAVDGILANGLNAAARRKLERYEGGLYDLAECDVMLANRRRIAALVFVAGNGRDAGSTRRWDIAAWRRRDKSRFLRKLKRRRRAG